MRSLTRQAAAEKLAARELFFQRFTDRPLFEIYGVESKAHNSSEFRGFINLDIRDFRDETERDYYNGAVANMKPRVQALLAPK